MDVPNTLYDTEYPEAKKYVTFKIEKGLHHLDGATALKYARSRHSTSDFDRSRRQQQIIETVVDKLMSKENIGSISRIRSLYNDYSKMVFTNISSSEMIGMYKYASRIKKMFSFVLTSECSYKSIRMT
ncbi:MAG: LCP family protein [bacterium]|nr:LCP family protein [bacterium]